MEATHSSVLLDKLGLRSKSDVAKLKPGQRELIAESMSNNSESENDYLWMPVDSYEQVSKGTPTNLCTSAPMQGKMSVGLNCYR